MAGGPWSHAHHLTYLFAAHGATPPTLLAEERAFIAIPLRILTLRAVLV